MAETQVIQAGQQPFGVREQGVTSNALPTPAPRPPRRNPVLSRADMVGVIRGGGSVIHRGEVIAHESHLPTEEDLARGDAEKEEQLQLTIAAQIESLNAQQRRLSAGKAKTETPEDDAAAKAEAERKAKEEADRKAKGGK